MAHDLTPHRGEIALILQQQTIENDDGDNTIIQLKPLKFVEFNDDIKKRVRLVYISSSFSKFKKIYSSMTPLQEHKKILCGVIDNTVYYIGMFGIHVTVLVQSYMQLHSIIDISYMSILVWYPGMIISNGISFWVNKDGSLVTS